MEYRQATRKDFPRIREMMQSLYREDPSDQVVGPEKMARTLEESLLWPEKLRLVIIEEEGQVLGYALLVNYWSNEYGSDIVFIDELFVVQGHRGRGAAKGFFEWLEKGCKPGTTFRLEVTPSNERAYNLYARLGFRPVRNRQLIWMPGKERKG
jgi:GNAT superfamily N-acetyltransferase